MPEETAPSGKFDVYADQFVVTTTPFGANLSFGVREAHPVTSRAPQSTTHGTIRMSVEHLKVMIYLVRRQVMKAEQDGVVKAEVAPQILHQMDIHPEDWDAFWQRKEFKL